jgi:PST family polysaccharide transporter
MGWIHVAAGRSDRWMRWGGFSAIVQLVALMAGLPFGVIGVATSYTIAMFVLFVPALVYSGRPVGIGTRDVLQAVGPQITAALIAVGVGFAVQLGFLTEFSRLLRFCISIVVCLAAYLTIVIGVFRVTDPLQLAFSVLRDFRSIRSPASS